ncbi:hypothetical protein Pmani_009267 [Petrolisthes manimaculis]|uniref:Uncharacterized protein n=1 Tax=Petrolisthes manimaculis TaxID=1843537 RepID=A0AAE1Q4M2_9EUCA|nr:hypothetical protein Pmani_009267 [Petrolisthes manimaculis]
MAVQVSPSQPKPRQQQKYTPTPNPHDARQAIKNKGVLAEQQLLAEKPVLGQDGRNGGRMAGMVAGWQEWWQDSRNGGSAAGMVAVRYDQ